MRIENIVLQLIAKDQNGFVQGRQAFHNTRRLLNILFAKNKARDHAILSLDAEKAFDRIGWKNHFNTLLQPDLVWVTDNLDGSNYYTLID